MANATRPERAARQSLSEVIRTQDRIADSYFQDQTLSGAEIEHLCFDNCEFDHCHFSSEGMDAITFSDCAFYDCRFTSQLLRYCEFNHCYLYHADREVTVDFSFCEINATKFINCDLTRVNFKRASLYNCEMVKCKMVGANFEATTFSHDVSKKVVINQFSVHECNLSYALFKHVNLGHCQLTESNFNYATFSNCDLEQTSFQGSTLSAATLEAISGADIDMRYAQLANINMSAEAIQHLIISDDACADLLTALGCVVE